MRSKGLSILLVTLGVLLLGAAAILFVVRQAQDKQRAAEFPSLIEKIEAALPERSAGVIENLADSAMAAVEIDGIDVIGLLELPGRGIKLPVSAEWDSSEQSFRPARFMGSVYDGTLIVGGRSEDGNFDFIDQLDAGEELTFTDMIGRVFRYTVRKICHADNARAETLADSESALTLFVKKMELFSSSDVQRHSILLNRRCRTAPVDNGKLRRPTRCRYDSLFNFLFITHEGPPLQIAALPGGRWPGAAHLIPGKTKLKYLYLCIPCLQHVEKPGCTLRSNRVFGIFAEESVENQEMVLVVPPPCCQLFQVHGSKLKLHPVCHLCEASVLCITHCVFFFCICKDTF